MNFNMTARLMLLLLRISSTVVISTTANEDQARTVIVLLDVTPSFQFQNQAVQQIQGIVRRLGPGDEFILVEVGEPPFEPSKRVRLQAMMPPVPDGLLVPGKNLQEWKRRQRLLSSIWAKVRKNQKAMLAFLKQPIALQRGGTDLYAALEYAAQRFAAKKGRLKILIIYSDLVQDLGEPTTYPPKKPFDGFDQTAVSVWFVPWESGAKYQDKEQKWRAYFEACHVQSFTMSEPALSSTLTPLSASRIPTTLKSPFSN